MPQLNKLLIAVTIFLTCISCKKSNPEKPILLTETVKGELWAHYDFKNGSLEDRSGNHHAIKLVNGAQLSADMFGNPGDALELNGNSGYAVIEDGKSFPDGDFSVNFVVMAKKVSGTIFEKSDFTSNKGASFGIGFNDPQNANRLIFTTDKNDNPCSSDIRTVSPTTLFNKRTFIPDAWYNVTVVYKDGMEKCYINAYDSTTLVTPVAPLKHCNSAPFVIGMSSPGSSSFAGKIDNIRIYTRALSFAEVDHIYWAYK